MKKNAFLLCCLVFLLAFALRVHQVGHPSTKFMDETGHVAAAVHYWHTGQFEPDHWEHPPLRPLLLYGFLEAFGENPYGWRLRNVLFGSLAAALTYLFALRVSDSRRTAFAAGLLMATDPLHVVLSRFTFCEVYSAAFFLAAVVLYLYHRGRSGWLFASAALVGCAMATKWYYFPGWFLLYLLALHENRNYRDAGNVAFITATYLCVPLAVYALSFFLWFGRGYSLAEFAEFVTNVFYSLQQYRAENYMGDLVFLSHLSAGEWFVRPVMVGQGRYLGGDSGEFILFLNNLPVWILTVPSLVGAAALALRQRCLKGALPVLFFVASYALYLFVRRPAFLYSVVPLLPFAFTLIACGITRTAARYCRYIYPAALALMLAWNLYLYPLVTCHPVHLARYRAVLQHTELKPL